MPTVVVVVVIVIVHGQKKIVVLNNQIVDIKLTKLFCFPNKFSVFPTNLFVEPTKEFVIAFCLTRVFVRRTKILLRPQKKVCQFYIFLRVVGCLLDKSR